MADMEAPLAKDLPREAHPATKVIMELWDHLIAFLRGSYEDIQAEMNSTSRAHATFILKWSRMLMLRLQGDNI